MLFNHLHIVIITSVSILANALPLDTKINNIVPRQKNYSVINVDGGSSDAAQATIIVKPTKTVQVINPGPTVTQEVTTTIANVVPAPTLTTSSSKSTSCVSSATLTPLPLSTSNSASSSSSIPMETPKPIFITVTVPKDDGPTEYYDNGLWHTNYRIKTFDAAVATVVPSVSISTIASSTMIPVLATLAE